LGCQREPTLAINRPETRWSTGKEEVRRKNILPGRSWPCSEQRPREDPEKVQEGVGEERSGEVIGHDAETGGERLEAGDTERLGDVQEPKEKEPNQYPDPAKAWKTHENKRDAGCFVENDLLGVLPADERGGGPTEEDGGKNEQQAEAHLVPQTVPSLDRLDQEPPPEEASGGAPGPGRREATEGAKGGDCHHHAESAMWRRCRIR
jgi:hypothetical protein